MYAAAKEKPRPFDIVLTWRSNRLFRDVEARLAYSRMFRSAGVRIATLHEPEYEGSTGRLAETIFGAIDEYYRSQTSEDTLRGLKLVARHGYSTGGRPPTGYRNERKATGKIKANGELEHRTVWVLDADMAPSVVKAFELYAQGKTMAEIAEATHIAAAKSSLSTLLRNRAYLGERIYNTTRRASLQEKKYHRVKNKPDDFVMVQGTHDALVSQDLFYRVQALLDHRRPKRQGRQTFRARDYTLSGLLWCSEHDVAYVGQSNGALSYYACGMRNKLGKDKASCPWMKKEIMEAFVLDTLRTRIFNRKVVREGLEALQADNTRARQQDDSQLKGTEASIAETKVKISRLIKAIEQGVDVAAVQPAINAAHRELEGQQLAYAELEKQRERALKIPVVTEAAVTEVLTNLKAVLDTTEPKELKAIVGRFIERIEIAGTKATFKYTFGESATENYASQWRPRGASGHNAISQFRLLPCSVRTGVDLPIAIVSGQAGHDPITCSLRRIASSKYRLSFVASSEALAYASATFKASSERATSQQ
jgi:site-specific DNA recombinase